MNTQYQDIINMVANNVGLASQSSIWIEITKADIYVELCKIFRKTKPIKLDISIPITSSVNEIIMPDNFYIPFEVVFLDTNNHLLKCKELQREEYMRWNKPNTILTEGEIFVSNNLDTSVETVETANDLELQFSIGYNFYYNNNSHYVQWKPAINGTIRILYSKQPDELSLLNNYSEIDSVFAELIALGVTVRQLSRKLIGVTKQEELFGLQAALNKYSEEYKDILNSFNGYVNSNTSTPLVEPFDFMNG